MRSKRPLLLAVAGIVVATGLLAAGGAKAAITLCNQTRDLLNFAVIYSHEWERGQWSWPMKGWFEIDRGSCLEVFVDYEGRAAYFSIVHIRDDYKTFIHPFAISENFDPNAEGAQGIAQPFCIQDGIIDGYRDRLVDYERCDEAEHFRQYFNLYILTQPGTRFTLDIPQLSYEE